MNPNAVNENHMKHLMNDSACNIEHNVILQSEPFIMNLNNEQREPFERMSCRPKTFNLARVKCFHCEPRVYFFAI
jgi:hypothetical protein